jgi:hypothetical protein
MGDVYDYEDEGEPNVGLAFGHGFFCKSDLGAMEDTNEVMSYLMPEYQICVQAFLVDDFEGDNDLGVEIIPTPQKNIAFIRLDRNLWEFIEDVAGCEHEALLYQGMILGELLVGTAHRIFANITGEHPQFL